MYSSVGSSSVVSSSVVSSSVVSSNHTISRIIHQIWIGPKPPPLNMLETWKSKHSPEFEYILWTEEEIRKRGMIFRCQTKIDTINEIVGKVDIMRLEILYQYGGIYVDADSICIEPFDDYFLCKTAFATYENENVRKGLVATGTMGFIPKHRLCLDLLDWIDSDLSEPYINKYKAWYSVGPALLTRFLDTGNYQDFSVFPSHCFLPFHFTGEKYLGHKKVYAYQEWANTKDIYDSIGLVVLPRELREPLRWISILITSFNTPRPYLKECLNSIKTQVGHFGMEIVWIDDGSDKELSEILVNELNCFMKQVRFCKVEHRRLEMNRGPSYCANMGVNLCSHELIFRMDSDDIMLPTRIEKQLNFMDSNPECVICGANIQPFTILNEKRKPTTHPTKITWNEFLVKRHDWFMNHPTLCFRKSAVLRVGNYNLYMNPGDIMEDYELILKLLKTYGTVYNLPEALVYYRLHPNQMTYKNPSHNPENIQKMVMLVDSIVNTYTANTPMNI